MAVKYLWHQYLYNNVLLIAYDTCHWSKVKNIFIPACNDTLKIYFYFMMAFNLNHTLTFWHFYVNRGFM